MQINKRNAQFALFALIKINAESSEFDNFGGENRIGLRPYGEDLFLGAMAQENTDVGTTLLYESDGNQLDAGDEFDTSNLLFSDIPQSYYRGTFFDNANHLKRRLDFDNMSGVEHDHCYLKGCKDQDFTRVVSTSSDESNENNLNMETGTEPNLHAKNATTDNPFLTLGQPNEADTANLCQTTVISRDRKIGIDGTTCRNQKNDISICTAKFAKSLASVPRAAGIKNLLVHVRNKDRPSKHVQKKSFMEYKRSIVLKLRSEITIEHKKVLKVIKKPNLLLFNMWVISDDWKDDRHILRYLYYKNSKHLSLASSSSRFKAHLRLSFKNGARFLYATNLQTLASQKSDHNQDQSTSGLSTEEKFAFNSFAENFFKGFCNVETIPEGLTASKVYTEFKSAFLMKADSEGTYVFNSRCKMLLKYIPELLVYVDWRIKMKNIIVLKEELAYEMQCLHNLFISYILGHNDIDDNVKKYRYSILNLFEHRIAKKNEQTHLYEIAINFRYCWDLSGEEWTKTSGIIFILSFIAENQTFDAALFEALKIPSITNITQSLLKNVRNAKNIDLEYILSLQILIEYYNYIGLCHSRKLLIFPWNAQTLVIFDHENIVQVELFSSPTIYVLLYDELMHDIL